MALPILILRPQPGASATVNALRDRGLVAQAVPLFDIVARPWDTASPSDYDALLLTSAQAARYAGSGLAVYADLPCYCVGAATAEAATAAGLTPAVVGAGGVTDLLDDVVGDNVPRLLWLCGVDHQTAPEARQDCAVTAVPVYAAQARASAAVQAELMDFHRHMAVRDAVVLLHSARAARRFAEIAADKWHYRAVAISDAVSAAAGSGWASMTVASRPDDAALVACATELCQKPADVADGLLLSRGNTKE